MNTNIILKMFCDSVIIDGKKDRIYHELVLQKRKGIDRFNHGALEIIKKEKIALLGSYEEIVEYINNTMNTGDEVLTIDCFDKKYKMLTKDDFIEKLSSDYLAVIGITSLNFAIIKEENHSGKYIYILRM